MSDARFSGKTVVVTGAARGIGDEIVTSFRESGANVYVLDLLPSPAPRPGVTYLQCDISDESSVTPAFKSIAENAGSVEVLVNNAGIQRVGLTGELAASEWNAVIGTNLSGAFLCSSAAVPLMRSGGGAIVHIASAAAHIGLPGRGPYTAAKAGLMGLTRVMAVELAPQGIRVNSVAPGFTRTGLVNEAIRDGYLREEWMVERVPMRRLGEPREIANVVLFVASDEASYLTGQTITVDGGWTIQGIGDAPGWLRSAQSDELESS